MQYLPGPIFGPYSFINVVDGVEEFDDSTHTWKNMVEVTLVIKILQKCFKAWLGSNENFSIGIVSPYSAQVLAIEDKLGQKYKKHDGFNVNVKTINGFQCQEHDIIILSTVRTNVNSSVGIISCPKRTNDVLSSARHCLWILGNEKILVSQESVWKRLVLDAKICQCFFNADEDEHLAKTIWNAQIELDQLDDLLNADSVVFRNSRWKVIFSDNFYKSFKKVRSDRRKKWVIGLLLKLSSGWRPKWKKVEVFCGNSSQMLMQFKVESLYVLCSKDIVKESSYTQVLKIWDILPLEDIPELVKRLQNLFGSYSDDFITHCNQKCFEGKMEVPMSWEKSPIVTKFKNLDNNGNAMKSSVCDDQRIYVENSMVKESLLLMKFYSLSPVVVSHLLSDCNGNEIDLPFEVTDEEQEIIRFPKSSFVLGRSGTGKTTVLIMKLFEKEKLHHMAVVAAYGVKCAQFPCSNEDKESSTMNDKPFLRQLFVTVSSRLCQVVKHHLVRLKRSICGDNVYGESSSTEDDIYYVDDASVLFNNVSDSFVDLPATCFPLVITFQKFLMMLDGTLGNSFFRRFSSILSSNSQNSGVISVALEIFIRNKEVTYERFDSLYWPHFNSQYTKNLDSSRVYKEIMSHIKGGIQAVEPGDGTLTRDDYLSISENRASSLCKQKREMIYDIYQSYEKMKIKKGEFDVADIVIDLHRRLRIEGYKGDGMSFVYIDEVQDLSMSQIALFKYVCQNTEEGFIFCGDTAQTIANGIDFRFQDIKSLFYNKFIFYPNRSSYNEGREKVKSLNMFLLNHNFRTHAGVLKLSQSIIDLLIYFFRYSIDVLKPETSFIHGEAPIVLECENGENAVETIFGRSSAEGGKIVGFGAEQAILVRDDSARKEVVDYVGKHALVLTILECKGLEFQDVLLYNFFESSPLRNRWRVIYEYMKEFDMLDSTELMSYPCYKDSIHNILCSELKQLYVAITRTRQRLWIYENGEEFPRPMLDYWKKKGVIQFKGLNDSLAQSMKVASDEEEWKSTGMKLYNQHNYDMATICFERAGDIFWERKSKAASLRASAKHLCDLNPKDANAMFMEAAQIFEGIRMVDAAAECFSDSGDHERAGDCFYLAKCYKVAAQVYARGNFFSDCLTVCVNGGLYDIGLDYIRQWKQSNHAGLIMVERHDLNTIEQMFLENCARNCLYRKDPSSMMKYVRAFHSLKLKREFLRSLNLLDELLVIEEESENYTEAADIAKLIGDIPRAADLLGNNDKFMEAYELIVSYVLANSLWAEGSKGWPLKQFTKKGELLKIALPFAKLVSSRFYELACIEVVILSNDNIDLFKTMIYLKSSRMYRSITGEILCLRKLLDAHFQLNCSEYLQQSNVFKNYVEETILKNRLSIETLFYCWTCWKDSIVQILKCLPSFESQDINEHNGYGKFVLGYFGAQKQSANASNNYLLLIPDAKFLRKKRRVVSVDIHFLVSAAESYWCSELLSVGMAVLHNLEAFYKFSLVEVLSEFCQFRSLMLIFEVSKFLLIESKCFRHNNRILETLKKFLRYPIDCSFCYVHPLDKRKSLLENMISLRVTEPCQKLIEEVIYGNFQGTDGLTYGKIGRVAVLILGMADLRTELFMEIIKSFKNNSPWKEFIQSLHWNSAEHSLFKFYKALQFTYNVNRKEEVDYISISCFMDLIERLLLLVSCMNGFIFATKSSFVEWLIYQNGNCFSVPHSSLIADILEFIADVLGRLLHNPKDTENWITESNLDLKDYFPSFVVRLVVLLCLLHLSSGKYEGLLQDLLRQRHITTHLPVEFFTVLCKGRKRLGLEVFAEAFKMFGNPLVIVRLSNDFSEIVCPDAISVDFINMFQQRKLMLQALFPNRIDYLGRETGAVVIYFPLRRKNISAHYVSFWDMLEKLQLAVDDSCLNRVLHYSKLLQV
ncbi:putative RNA helicase [Lupinus albus]|uniref:Putative RNA helicase n=1 Tax=Lupinus albus TaxID=3870 RepID=A0A6A4Q9W4_LUPAL|nr:putative RNA helicase [Lupinus albus]